MDTDKKDPALQGDPTADTPKDQPSASPTPDSVDTKKDQVDTSTPTDATTEDKEAIKAKREEGKLQQVQKEKKELEESHAKLKTQSENVNKALMSDPKQLKWALMNTSGKTEEEADQVVRQYHPDWKKEEGGEDTKPEEAKPQPVDQLTEVAGYELLEEKKAEILEKQRLAQEYYKEHYENKPEASPERYDLVLKRAKILSKEGLSPKEALAEAHRREYDFNKIIKEAEERGENKSLAEMSSISSSTMRSPSGTTTKGSEPEPDVPAAEWRDALANGFTDKAEYVMYRDNPRVGVE